jgi:sugar lactone lactonase YvrE
MSSREAFRSEPRVLLSGLAYVESPRWHDDRLWFAHWGAGEIVAVDLDGVSEVVGYGPQGLGWSIEWLPDGRLLTTGERLVRREPDGSDAPARRPERAVGRLERDRRERAREHLRQRSL